MRTPVHVTTFLTLLSLTLFTGCGKSKIDPGTGDGISYRDSSNNPVGAQDDTDWTSDATWNAKEKDLFKDLAMDLNGAQKIDAVRSISLYPNPNKVGSISSLILRASTSSVLRRLAIVIVDKKYKVKHRSEPSLYGNGQLLTTLALPAGEYKSGEYYRLYYVLYEPDNQLLYKGHGDIKLVE
ncbi:hypothetical protein [Hymenobacter jeollabukensis]|uniref:Lipoprotein n=1 Tax=Hymenobacter jeollabukensis TaxID=2025313 RepID=A0A5R8WN54_9BACT|nr:hypothetical protein [Hymenobacter jeollabukensis]TLM90529.1 hypothetical protein FDY95_17595 [Hymenobacter jeollabukensis]